MKIIHNPKQAAFSVKLLLTKFKNKIFFLLYSIIALNGLAFLFFILIFYVSTQNLQKTVNESEQMDHFVDDLMRIEVVLGDLNAPGNRIFETQNIRTESEKLAAANQIFQALTKDLIADLSKPGVPNSTITRVKIDAIIKKSSDIVTKTEEIFLAFQTQELGLAANKMAQMDNIYTEIRKDILEIRRDWRIEDHRLTQSEQETIRFYSGIAIKIMGLNFLLIALLVWLGNLVSRKTRQSEKLAESFRYALDRSSIVSITDPRGTITYANDAFREISGYRKEELLGQNHRLISSGHHPEIFFKELWETIVKGQIWRGEIKNKKKDGTPFWVDATIVPIIDSRGQITEYIGIRFDITEKKRMSEELEKSEERFSLAIEGISVGIWDWNIAAGTRYLSPKFCRLLGFDPNEMMALDGGPRELVHPSEIDHLTSLLQRHFDQDTDFDLECRLKTRTGGYRWFRTTGKSLKDAENKPLRMVGSIQDIHDKKIAENALVEAKNLAESGSRAKASFLANMSHEIRTPLNGILGLTTLLGDQPLTPEGRKHLDIMKKSGDTLLALINDILDFSKIEAQKLTLEEVAFNLEDIIQETVSIVYLKAKDKGLQIHIDVANDLPQSVKADVTRLRQVLINLLSNAIKFTNKGSITVQAKIEEQLSNGYLIQINVIDTGMGIKEEEKSKLFQSFSQIDASTTRRFGGTGLGLAICRGICQAMGGKIWVESKVGIGSTFSFNILVKHSQKIEESITTPERFQNQGVINPLKILIADDHATNQLLAKKFLEKIGYAADVVNNGMEVLEVLKHQQYDVIFMDGHMPILDGYETTKKLCELYGSAERPWIIALTASASLEDQEKCRQAGMNDFVAKPFNVNSLIQALARMPRSPRVETRTGS